MFKVCTKKERTKVINYFFSRYEIDKEYFNNYLFIKKSKSLFVINNTHQEIIKEIINKKKVRSLGLELFCDLKKMIPSSIGFSGLIKTSQIKTNYVVLEREEAISFFENKKISLKKVIDKNLLSEGYVIGIYDNQVIGTFYYNKEKDILEPNLSFKNKDVK